MLRHLHVIGLLYLIFIIVSLPSTTLAGQLENNTQGTSSPIIEAERHISNADTLASHKQYCEALAEYDKAIAIYTGMTNAYSSKLNIINKLYRAGSEDEMRYFKKSLADYNNMIAKSPDDITTRLYKWDTLRRLGLLGEANDLLVVLIDRNPKQTIGFMHLLNLYDDILVSIDNALSTDPSNYKLYYEKAVLLGDQNNYEEALSAIDKAIECNPGYAYYQAKAEAVNYKIVLNNISGIDEKPIEPWDIMAWSSYDRKGSLLIKLGRYKEAARAYYMADIAGRGGSEDTLLFLAFALQKCNGVENMKTADTLLKLLVNSNSDFVKIEALSLLGRKTEMIKLITDLTKQKPNYTNFLRTSPVFEAYRDDPDFAAIVGSD